MILVVGATGFLGMEVCRLLCEKGKSVRALVRSSSDKAKVDKLKSYGISVTEGNLKDRNSLETACADMESVISTASSMPFGYVPGENDIQTTDLDGLKNLIDAAKASGISKFIYTSFSGNLDLNFQLRNAKRTVETYLQKSGMDYTVLRPGCFMEVWLTAAVGFDADNAKVQIFGDGSNPVSYISLFDVAKFAVESLSNELAQNAVLELGGPENLTQLEAVSIFEKVTGKTFEKQNIPAEALKSQMESAEDPMQQSFSGLMACVAAGDSIDMQDILKSFPVHLKTVGEYARASSIKIS